MNTRYLDHLYIFFMIVLTVYGQLILKWRISLAGSLPTENLEKIKFVLFLLLDPWVISGFCAVFAASLVWMAAMTKFELSYAYPFMSLNFVIVVLLSGWLFSEPITPPKLVGVTLIVLGTVVLARN